MARGARATGAKKSISRSTVISWIAGVAALAVLATIAVVAAGYDAREAPRQEPSVWAMRSSGQYARVNTLTGEIDTVRSVEDPSGMLQSGSHGAVLTRGNGRIWPIDAALPRDIAEEIGKGAADDDAEAEAETSAQGDGPAAMRAPDGTRDTVSAGDYVVFRTEDGATYLSQFAGAADASASIPAAEGMLSEPRLLDPFAEERAAQNSSEDVEDETEIANFVADAAAVDADGHVALFSAEAAEVRWYDAKSGRFTGVDETPDGIDVDSVQLAIVAGRWAILEPAAGAVVLQGSDEPVDIEGSPDALLQASTADGSSDVFVADGAGLWRIAGGSAERELSFDGVPAQPTPVGETLYAAWLGQSGAQLWSSDAGEADLEVDPDYEMPSEPEPSIRSNGTSALVAETRSGMMWTVPDGKLIPVAQWKLVDPPKDRNGTVVVSDVTEQEPPVAVPDSFGVRAGEPALLPVLLNDFDPNRRDVLTIVPDGLGKGLDKNFGSVSLLPDGQQLVVRPQAKASGSAKFTYRITDGTHTSDAATVTLRVMGDDTNTAPAWCPVDGCQRSWPSPEVSPGGTLVMPVLDGWVDPEGDPMMLQSARAVNESDPVRVLVTADGRLAMRHTDVNAPDSDVVVRVRVADARGEAEERDMTVQVRSNARAAMEAMAATVEVDRASTLRPLRRIVGGSGAYALIDASVQSGRAEVSVNAAAGTLDVRAAEEGVSIVAITARDTGTDAEITGTLRVSAVESRSRLGLPPLRAFVRPLADTTVNVLDAVPGSDARMLVVKSADVVDGELRVDVLDHDQVRVSGRTVDGAPGRIGAADVTIEEGSTTAVGRLTVFQVPEASEGGAIAVADSITVRAGAVADIPVLDNDVSPAGQRLVLHPEIGGSGQDGELAFASGNTLRYLAPKKPGTYTLSYTTYGASSPELSDVGQVRVKVLPRENNRDPQPRALTVRIAPGERSTVQVPLSSVDPDGDRVRLIGVSSADDPQLTTMLVPRTFAIQVEASKKAEPGVQQLTYGVRDEYGGEAEGRLRVIVTEGDPSKSAPVTYSDYVRLAKGAKDAAVVRPLDNDFDPADGKLEIVRVVPNVPGGPESEAYRTLEKRLDLTDLEKGRVSVTGGDELGTTSYRYTVKSSETSSTSDGLIVVQVSARVGQQAPTVRDTVLSASDRHDLADGGIDVVTDHIFWAAGDVSQLKLSVWGDAADRFTAKGSNISGEYRAEGDLVAFRVAGTDLTGQDVESFGFLIVPPLDELRLTLQPGLSPLKVDEDESVNASLGDLVALAEGDHAEFKVGPFPTQRGQARCEATSDGNLVYAAGHEGPWSDTCLISVKLTEQSAWTQLSVPVEIVPNDPVAELEPLTRTIAPGESETINLMDMVRWQGGREGNPADLVFEVAGGGVGFDVQPAGAQVTATGRADAVPGSEDPLTVSVTTAGETNQAPLTLRVGEAAADEPKGATVQLNCTVGSSCQAALIGVSGEYDPFAGKRGGGLELVSVDDSGCAAASFQASGDGVNVTWPGGSGGPGGKCTTGYTVKDAQGRTGQGLIELDAQGLPRAPTSVTPVSADSSSVTLSVSLNSEASYPATTGVELVADGAAVGSCSMEGGQASCRVTGLKPGVHRTYFARAVNSVGESERSANGAETWAYQPPAPPSISGGDPVPWEDNTDTSQGRTKVRIGDSTGTPVLTIDGAEAKISGDGVYTLPSGSREFSVISVDAAGALPPGYTGDDGGRGSAATLTARVIGAPTSGSAGLSLVLEGERRTNWALSASGFGENGGDSLTYHYVLLQEGEEYTSDDTGRTTISGSSLDPNQNFRGTVYATNSYGRTGTFESNEELSGLKMPDPKGTYDVSDTPEQQNGGFRYVWRAGKVEFSNVRDDGKVQDYDDPTPSNPTPTVQQCPKGGWGRISPNCSDPAQILPTGLYPAQLSYLGKSNQMPRDEANNYPDFNTMLGYFELVVGSGENITAITPVEGTNDVDVTVGTRAPVRFVNVIEAPHEIEQPPTDDPPTDDPPGDDTGTEEPPLDDPPAEGAPTPPAAGMPVPGAVSRDPAAAGLAAAAPTDPATT